VFGTLYEIYFLLINLLQGGDFAAVSTEATQVQKYGGDNLKKASNVLPRRRRGNWAANVFRV
jgi:hypothetical protein